MAGTVRHARLGSPSARDKLKRGRQPHWQALVEGQVHLGWQCWKGDPCGRWLLRRYIGGGKYRVQCLGRADDAAAAPANGADVLSFAQAEAKARTIVATPGTAGKQGTVRQAMERYIAFKRDQGQPVSDLSCRTRVHILPALGDLMVGALTAAQLRKWHATMAAAPAQGRPKAGKPQYKAAPVTDEDVRRRRASANRVLTMLKAGLNHAFDEDHVANRDAWGRKLKPFRNVGGARVRYLTDDEVQRLLNTCDADFRALVRAALETGCRYSELIRLEITDFNPDAGTLHIRKSKTGKTRHVILTPEGANFFRQHCAGHTGSELMFRREDGHPWQKSNQARPMKEACARAKITPRISFHILRHTWASHAVMNGVPLLVVARNLGHRDTRMVEHHYGHLAPSFIIDAIRAGAPRYGIKDGKGKVVPLR
jgi:integrase